MERFYEHSPAKTIRATAARLLTDRDEGMDMEVQGYCWMEITLDELCDMDPKQVVLPGLDFRVSAKRPGEAGGSERLRTKSSGGRRNV